MSTNELVEENFGCVRRALDAIKLTSFASENDLPQSPRKGLETRAIVTCGGKYTFCYLPEKDEWKRLSEKNKKTQLINFRDQLYAFPETSNAERYDPVCNDAIKLTSFASEDDLPQSPRKGLETRAIVACGKKYTFCYLPENDEWKRLADGLSEKNKKTQLINFRDQLYAFPQTSNAERYDPVFNVWSILDLCANSAMVTVVRGQIYAIKVDTSTEQSTISRYNVELCSWETVLTSHQGCREKSCVVTAGNHLYVIGGKPPHWEYVAKAERFDTVEKKWEEIADMQQARGVLVVWLLKGRFLLPEGSTETPGCRKPVRCTMFLQTNGNLLET
ncbi:Kelch-like member 33 [Desmophyllum pertusum]|uniref:Kelch-like member 33 n=1 Tax=Desmophyllum pertusum TaxID=174260 RepID=A0A9W9YMM6_9CNID|nr:Kelch-like member 33 [Desmophyllum pertusum]